MKSWLRTGGGWLSLALIPGTAALAQGRASADSSEAGLFRAREAVWRDYFANGPGLARALPENFVAIQAGDSTWEGRQGTLAGARASVERGVRLTDLRFPRNVVQRYGNVAVIHSRYEADLTGPDGPTVLRGQITEVFVWKAGRWIHPSWHMEVDPLAGPRTSKK